MKTSILKICILTALSSLTVQAENLVVNGDFETGTGNAFYATPPWWNAGKGYNQGTDARGNTRAVIKDSYSASVNDRYNKADGKTGGICFAQKTAYTIREGDTFSLAYDWYPLDEWWQISRDTIRFVLFATDNNKLNGKMVWSSEHLAPFFTGSIGGPNSVLQKTSVVSPEAVGKTLFLIFHGIDTVDGEKESTHWARVDNIVVELVDTKSAP